MKNKIKKYLKEILILVVMLTITLNLVSYYKSLDLNKEKLDSYSFKLLDDSTFNFDKDKPILVHFWATWCPTCKFEAANIEKISKDYQVITIAVQSGSDFDIQNYLDEHNLNFKVVNDEYGYFSNKFNIKAFPTTLTYDSNGNQTFSEVGYTSTIGLYLRMIFSS
jgi:thiol-disulfide isomerase/thioredoxin